MQFYRSLPAIKAMTFDLDDTLYDNHPVIVRVEQEVLAWLHTEFPACRALAVEEWHRIKRELAKQNPDVVHDVTQWRRRQIVVGLESCGYRREQAEAGSLAALEQVYYWRNQVEVPQQTHEVMTELARRYPLVAITNGNVDPHKIGIGHYFSHILRAGPDGRQKPWPDMFERAHQLLGVEKPSILHVGDHPDSDITGAKQAGLSACWIHHNQLSDNKIRLLPDVAVGSLSSLLKL